MNPFRESLFRISGLRPAGVRLGATSWYFWGRTVQIFEDGWEIERRTENSWLVHCNWGWGNSSKDGYYQSGIFNANDGAGPYTDYIGYYGTRSDDLYFRTNLQVIPYIYPKQNLQ